ncbi:aspartate/glutamate racemase family protein [Tenacibaculum sp. M341]|uniref:aspartate/glutamate racemase family protein n=1 Tax=Tenacibaculum sp. M341 TaxID=2530339 RepID=UPI00104609B9|nr:amino acid racemase [Tenacibaculum sp. M341]TCI85716.1 aspartate/glutamate racemase family protein [Tenacibaculum sp. M341]
MNEEKVIGIVGGMGPESGIMLCNYINCLTPVTKDQEHFSVILMSFPKLIVDRTAFLDGETAINPAFQIAKIIAKLETAGASIIGIACNTAHSDVIFDQIKKELSTGMSTVKLLHMPEITCNQLAYQFPEVRKVGVISTNGTYKSKIYEQLLKEKGYEVVLPDVVFQNEVVHKMIYDADFGIKANPNIRTQEVRQLKNKTLEFFSKNNVEAIILGCTELSLIFFDDIPGIKIIDSTMSLAKALVEEASVKQFSTI